MWRSSTALQQGWMVISWAVLMQLRQRWLSRGAARAALVVSLCGFLWYLMVNFVFVDPLVDPVQWRSKLARGVGGRVLSVWVEQALAGLFWVWVILL
jgi:hypothetical protein